MAVQRYKHQPDDRIPDDLTKAGAGASLRTSMIAKDRALLRLQAVVEEEGDTFTTISAFPDESDYFYLPGRSGSPGQIAYFSIDSAGTGSLRSTSHATKGKILFGAAGTTAYDEANERWGVGTASPSAKLHVTNATDAAVIGGRVTLHASQSVDAFLVESSAAAVLLGITKDGDIYRNGGSTLNITGGAVAVNVNAGPTNAFWVGQTVFVNKDGNATSGSSRMEIRASSGQSSDMLRFRNAADSANLSAFTADARLGLGADAANGMQLDVTGSIALRQLAKTVSSTETAWDLSGGTFVRVTVSGNQTIHGIDSGVNGSVKLVYFVASASTITIAAQSGSAAVADRIQTEGNLNITTFGDEMFVFIYDSAVSRWNCRKWIGTGAQTIRSDWDFRGLLHVDGSGTGDKFGLLQVSIDGLGSPWLVLFDNATGYTSYIELATQTADGRVFSLPALSTSNDVFVMADLAYTLKAKSMFTDTVLQATSASVGAAFTDTTTSTKKLRFTLSGAVGNNAITVADTAARTWALDSDFDSRLMTSGNNAVAAGGAGTAGLLGKHDSTGNTATIAATTLGNTVPVGMYRLTVYLKVTTASAGGTLTVSCNWNDGTAQSATLTAEHDVTGVTALSTTIVNTAYSLTKTLYSAASQNVTFTVTMTGTPTYTCIARLEAL